MVHLAYKEAEKPGYQLKTKKAYNASKRSTQKAAKNISCLKRCSQKIPDRKMLTNQSSKWSTQERAFHLLIQSLCKCSLIQKSTTKNTKEKPILSVINCLSKWLHHNDTKHSAKEWTKTLKCACQHLQIMASSTNNTVHMPYQKI